MGRRAARHRSSRDFLLADRRNAKAAKRFLAKALRRSRDWKPHIINTDKNPAYGEAIVELKKEGLLPKDIRHRQVKYLNMSIGMETGPRIGMQKGPPAGGCVGRLSR